MSSPYRKSAVPRWRKLLELLDRHTMRQRQRRRPRKPVWRPRRSVLVCVVIAPLTLGASCDTTKRPGPPTPPPDRSSLCRQACELWQQWDCKESEPVCQAFDDAGECTAEQPCAEACVQDPQAYPDPQCAIDLDPVPAEPCGACPIDA